MRFRHGMMLVNKKEKIINKEFIQFYSLFFLTVFFVYYTPSIFNKLYFILLLVFFGNSKKDYFWFVFVFILVSEPGGLFGGGSAAYTHRIPLYNIMPGVSFDFFDLFFISAFIKALIKGTRVKLILKKPLTLLLFYLIFLFLMSLFIGMNFNLITAWLRKFTVFTLFFSFPHLVYKKEDFYKVMHLVFPIVFIIIFAQFFHLFTGNRLRGFMSGQSTASIIELQGTNGYTDFIRPTSIGVMLIFFCFIFTLFLMEKKDYAGKRSYLYLIFVLCFLAEFLTASRSWIVMFVVVLFLYSIFIAEKQDLFVRLIVIFVLLFTSYLLIPRLKYSVDNSLRRLSTLEALVQGDVTADGTLIRIDRRLPKVLEGFEKKPVFGWGFSETYQKYTDYHVGTFNVALQVGIVGLMVFLFLGIRYLKMITFTRKRLTKNNVLKKPLLVLLISFLGMLILQSTTFVFFSYDLFKDVAYFIILFISFSEFLVKEALRNETYKRKPVRAGMSKEIK